MTHRIRIPSFCLSAAIILTPFGAAQVAAAPSDTIPLSASTMIIEYNSSAEDIGIQFFLDSDGWTSIVITDPKGDEVFSAEAEGRLVRQGGGTELFLESVEPEISELPFAKFFKRFPEGTYQFRGETAEGDTLVGQADFTHNIPAGPEVIAPVGPGGGCAVGVSIPVTIDWEPVTTSIFGDPIDIKGYEVIVENDVDTNFDVHLREDVGTALTVSPELLKPGADYIFEVLAIEEGGNQTITEGCFSTAP